MCSQRIDADYSHLSSIDEKKSPEDRFNQLKEELSLDDEVLHHLKINSLSSFHDWFYGSEDIKKALIESRKHLTIQGKVAAFLKHSYPRQTFGRDMDLFYKGQDISHNPRINSEKKQKIQFLIELAKSFYPDSFYELYSSEFGRIFSLSFLNLSTIYHGEEYYFSSACFDDLALNSLGHSERTEFFWSIFNELNASQIIISKKQQIPKDYNYELLVNFIKSENDDSNYQSVEENLDRGFRFLKAWITNDAKNGRSFSELISVINEIYYYLSCRLYSSDHPENNELTLPWLREFKLELQWLLLQHFDLSKASEPEVVVWIDLIEELYREITYKIEDKNDSPYLQQEHFEFNKLVKALPNDSVKHWLQSNIRQDIKKALEGSLSTYNLLQSKWCFGETYNAWKAEFLQQLNQLSAYERVKLLSIAPPFPGHPTHELSEDAPDFYKKHSIWWSSLYLELATSEDFEKQYLPEWTITAKSKAGTPELVPYIDQSIGILRGQIFGESSESDNDELMQQLSGLLTWLEKDKPEKALRHRLMLFRSSKTPLCDEGLNYRTKAEDCLWYLPLKDLKPSNFDSTKSLNDSLNEFYQSLAQEISTFCLSKLQLRKKEKAIDGKYSSNQVVEMSPTWRQGYLKAIAEIGLDLNGKAHKTAHFIRQADEDENVRAIAAETYKAVRRSDNSNPSTSDLKRGIIAAEWWLLHCQRQELGLEINSEEALKTRRRLLRNP